MPGELVIGRKMRFQISVAMVIATLVPVDTMQIAHTPDLE